MIVGAVFGALTLFFFMGLVLLGVAGHAVPCNTVFLVNITLSLGAALAVGFLGGNATATGAIPFLHNSLAVSLTGGLAALVVTLIVTTSVVGKDDCAITVTKPQGRAIWEKNLDAMRMTNSGLGSSRANECGYNFWTHKETLVSALTALDLDSSPELRATRDQLLAAVNNMPAKCGSDDWYNLAVSPAMKDLQAKLLMGVRAKVIENGGNPPN